MPQDEPDARLDAALRETARRRREQYGPKRDMPGYMRAILQREIARATEGESASRQRARFGVSMHFVRWASAVCLLMIALGVPLWLRVRAPEHASKREATPSERNDHAEVSSAVSGDFANRNEELPAVVTAPVTTMPASPSAPPPAIADSRAAAPPTGSDKPAGRYADVLRGGASPPFTTGKDLEDRANDYAARTESPAAAEPATGSGKADLSRANVARSLNMNFAQVPGGERKAKKNESLVLQNFGMNVDGESVRFADEDGSEYAGRIIPAETEHVLRQSGGAGVEMRRESERAPAPAASTAGELAGTDKNLYYFRASGENRTLQKRIIFEGTLVVADDVVSDEAPVAAPGNSAALAEAAASSTESVAPATPARTTVSPEEMTKARLVPSARILGNARLNGTADLQIDAIAQ